MVNRVLVALQKTPRSPATHSKLKLTPAPLKTSFKNMILNANEGCSQANRQKIRLVERFFGDTDERIIVTFSFPKICHWLGSAALIYFEAKNDLVSMLSI